MKHNDCLVGTRVDILDDIRTWKRTVDDNAKSVYCIQDVAGSGKSTIAYTMAQEWGIGECLMFFFSDYSRAGARSLCNSLAKQIIGSCYGAGWAAHWGGIPSSLSSPITNVARLWTKLVAEPLGKCAVHQSHVLIVDALDECDHSTRCELLTCLLRSCSSLSQPRLRVLLTTRVQDDLRRILDQECFRDAIICRSLLSLQSSLSDITQYVQNRLDNSPILQLTETQRDQLVQRCGGLFIFASVACNELEKECAEDQPLQLQDMLQKYTSLDALYHRALSQAEKSAKYARGRLKDILHVILFAQEAPSITTIAALLSMSTTSVDMFVKRLGSIIVSGADHQPVYIIHATLAEFLLRQNWMETKGDVEGDMEETDRENRYYITRDEGHRTVLKGCLSNVMAKQLKFNICLLETSSVWNEKVKDMDDRINRWITPALRYSCLHWATHLSSTSFDDEIFTSLRHFMNHQFLFWLEVLSVIKRVGLASNMLKLLIDWIKV
jgi:NACHT domain